MITNSLIQRISEVNAKRIVDDEWIDREDIKNEWTSTEFAEYVDNKMNLYNREVLKNNKTFDNNKGYILNSIIKYMKTQASNNKFNFLN